MVLQPGQVLNRRYRIDAQIGHGSLGSVYAGWDLNLNTAIVVKEQRDASPEATRKFTRQARALANLRHPGLPYVIDHFSLPEQGQYLVSEFINGQDLQAMLVQSSRGLPDWQALPWLLQVCDALIYLHNQSPPLFHRDIKPANLRITPQGKAVLVDYGIGLASDPDHAATSVGGLASGATALVVGNAYTAPEQFDGYSDARGDLYSLAASFYAALTGRPPSDSRARLAGQALPALRRLNPAISPALEAVILQAMQLDPEQRFQTVKAFQTALEAVSQTVSGLGVQPVRVVNLPTPPQVAATMQATYPAEPFAGPGRNAAGSLAAGATAVYPYPADDLPGFDAPMPNRKRRWLGIGAGVVLLACLLLSVIAGGGAYLLWNYPGATPFDAAQAIAATLTAEATRRMQAVQPTLDPTPIVPPVATHTLPPTLALEPSPLPTVTPSPTLTSTPTETATPTEKSTWQPCPAVYPSRLYIGDTATVSQDPPLPNRVRDQPTTTSNVLGFIQPGEQVQIIGGPVCYNEWIWWQVSSLSTGLTGWTAEGDRQNYWLAPER